MKKILIVTGIIAGIISLIMILVETFPQLSFQQFIHNDTNKTEHELPTLNIATRDSVSTLNNNKISASQLLKMANNDYYLGKTSEAIVHALKALDVFKTTGDNKQVAKTLLLIGDILRGNNLYVQSLTYLTEALSLAAKENDSLLLGSAFNRMAALFLENPRVDSSLTVYFANLSQNIARKNKNDSLIFNNLNILGVYATKQQKYRESIEYLEEAYPLVLRVFPKDEALILINIARNYHFLKQDTKAKKMLLDALDKSLGLHIQQYIRLSTLVLNDIFIREGDFKKAHFYNQIYYQSKEFVLSQKVQVQLIEFNTKMKDEIQNREKQRLLYEKKLIKEKLFRVRIIGTFLIGLLIIILVFLIYFRQQKLKIKNIAAHLEKSNKTLLRFISVLGHDLRSPFNAMLGFSDLLKNESLTNEAEHKLLINHLHQSIRSTFNLLESILEWSRLQAGAIKPVKTNCNLSELVSETIQLLESSAILKKIVILYETRTSANVLIDRNMILVTLRNILSNAIKFTHNGGCVRISLSIENSQAVLEFMDNGIGIEPDVIKKLAKLEENYKSHGTNGEHGSGLGLILCSEYLEMHNGKLEIFSEKNKGSSFVIKLPLEKIA
jgi:signal transduction histidine kinase